MRYLLWLLCSSIFLISCSEQETGITIQGQIKQADNLQLYLDKLIIGKPGTELLKTSVGQNGAFSLTSEEPLAPGVYQIRVGAYRIPIFLDKDNQPMQLEADLGELDQMQVGVSGSPATQAFYQFLTTHPNPFPDDVRQFVDTTSFPYAGAWLTFLLWRNRVDLLDLHQAAQAKLATAYPEAPNTAQYAAFIQSRELEYAKKMADQRIQVGNPAPNIELPSPSGQPLALEDLKGKVVLLDFWASWCGPCRRENPNVVKVYQKYKDQGFSIFSVSLDGLDSRTKARLSRPDQIEKVEQQQRAKWLQAIEKDQLTWETHVSDLKGWESEAAALYGVQSIPQTYLIDREGKIAVINIRGASALERELKKLL